MDITNRSSSVRTWSTCIFICLVTSGKIFEDPREGILRYPPAGDRITPLVISFCMYLLFLCGILG